MTEILNEFDSKYAELERRYNQKVSDNINLIKTNVQLKEMH